VKKRIAVCLIQWQSRKWQSKNVLHYSARQWNSEGHFHWWKLEVTLVGHNLSRGALTFFYNLFQCEGWLFWCCWNSPQAGRSKLENLSSCFVNGNSSSSCGNLTKFMVQKAGVCKTNTGSIMEKMSSQWTLHAHHQGLSYLLLVLLLWNLNFTTKAMFTFGECGT
jgi:hypothetical protein